MKKGAMPGGQYFYTKNSDQTCFMCSGLATTGDHIPPKGLFATSLREKYKFLKVPACEAHNNCSKQDDEYVRVILAAGSPDSEAALKLFYERIIPRAVESGRKGLLPHINSLMKLVLLRHPNGILEPRYRFEIDKSRLQNVVDKIVKGLYWHHNGKRLSSGYVVGPYLWNRKWSDEEKQAIWNQRIYSVGHPSVFEYRYVEIEKNHNKVYVAMCFFKKNVIEATIHHA